MISPTDLARIFLDPRSRRGRQFGIRPHWRRYHGLAAFDVRCGSVQQRVLARPSSTDLEVFHHIFTYRTYDTRNFARYPEIVASFVPEESLILDLGAYVGYSSLYFSCVWPGSLVAAVEPDRDNYALLTKNVTNRPITPMLAAAGHDGWVTIVNPTDEAYGRRTQIVDASEPQAVQSVSVPTLLATFKERRPFLCKIDIEGAEADLFDGNTAWIDEFPIVIVELHDWLFPKKRTALNFLKACAERNRDFLISDENIVSIRN